MGNTCGACSSSLEWACCATSDDINFDLNHGQIESGQKDLSKRTFK